MVACNALSLTDTRVVDRSFDSHCRSCVRDLALSPLASSSQARRSTSAIRSLPLCAILRLGQRLAHHVDRAVLVLVRDGIARHIFPFVRESIIYDSRHSRLMAHAASVAGGAYRSRRVFRLLCCHHYRVDSIYRTMGKAMKPSNQSLEPTAGRCEVHV